MLVSTQLKSLKSGDHKDDRGLMLRVSKSGDLRTWTLAYSFGKKRRKMKIGTFPEVSLSHARRERDRLRVLIADGIDPMAETEKVLEVTKTEAAEKLTKTVAALADKFIATHGKTLKPTSLRLYTLFLQRKFVPMYGEMQIVEVNRTHISDFIETLDDRPASATAAFKVLRKFLRWCHRTKGLITSNPCYDMDPPPANVSPKRVLSAEEVKALMGVVRKKGDPYSLLVQLLMLTACRLDEIRTLRWSDVDLEEGTLTIENTKNDSTHTVALSRQALHLLRTLPQHGQYVVSADLGKTAFTGVPSAKGRLDAACGVIGWRNHDLRRTAATRMEELDVQRHIVKVVLNHSFGDVTSIYTRSELIKQKRKALQTLADYYDEVAGIHSPIALAG